MREDGPKGVECELPACPATNGELGAADRTRRPNDREPTTTDDEAADRLNRGCSAGSGR
jgi:hypothetical protein